MNSKTTAELFGENLRNQLVVKNKSQADIARHLKVTEASVSRWVNGLSMPRANMIDKLCLFLHCSVEDLTVDHSKQVEDVFVGNWKEVYQMLDAEHRRGFWRNLIEELVIGEDGKPVGIKFLY